MKNAIIFMLAAMMLIGIAAAQQEPSNDCLGGVPAVYYNGLWWAWASPCSGGCSQATPSTYGYDQYGWRWVADDTEWSLRPDKTLFDPNHDQYVDTLCASKYFDPDYTHCDYVNEPAYKYDSGFAELWFVHDACEAGSDDGGNVPEFTAIGAGIALIGAGLVAFRKRER
jgi:hypothetical protein